MCGQLTAGNILLESVLLYVKGFHCQFLSGLKDRDKVVLEIAAQQSKSPFHPFSIFDLIIGMFVFVAHQVDEVVQ